MWSSSSDSEEDPDIFAKKENASNSVISNDPIRWDENSKKKRDKNRNTPRQKLLPSFTKCGSIEVVDNLPPPPILRLGSYNNNRSSKSITSSDKISCSNGANNLSKRKRKQNTTAVVASHDVSTKTTESKSRDKNKTTIAKGMILF